MSKSTTGIMSTVNNCIEYWKYAKRVNIRCSSHTHREKVTMRDDILVSSTIVIISLCVYT